MNIYSLLSLALSSFLVGFLLRGYLERQDRIRQLRVEIAQLLRWAKEKGEEGA